MNEQQPSAPTGGSAAARRADRYGTDRFAGTPRTGRRRLALAAVLVVVVAGLGVAYVGFQKYGPADIEAEQLGYTVVDDSTLTVRLKVTRDDPTRPAVCFVRAMDRDSAEVGRREVLIMPSEAGTVELTTVVRSSSRPSAGDIYACSDNVPEYLRSR